jgi:putative ABC transport system substrate-binding protein
MMPRSALATVLGFVLLAAPMAADAQPAGKVQRVGFLAGSSPTAPWRQGEAFEQGLRELGWVERQNMVVEYRFAEGRHDRLPDLAADLVRLRVDVIVGLGNAAAAAAKSATPTIPIVMVSVADPVALGLIESLARPGGNVTGLADSTGTETAGKRLELLTEIAPKLRWVAVLSNRANPVQPRAMDAVKAAAQSLGVQLQLVEVRGSHEFDRAFAAMAKQRAGALLVVTEAMFTPHRARLADLAAKNKLPAMYGHREFVEAGGLMSYGASLNALLRRAAFFVDRILTGTQPTDLPVEQPTKFDLVVNTKTARALGLTIPQSLLLRADQVID